MLSNKKRQDVLVKLAAKGSGAGEKILVTKGFANLPSMRNKTKMEKNLRKWPRGYPTQRKLSPRERLANFLWAGGYLPS